MQTASAKLQALLDKCNEHDIDVTTLKSVRKFYNEKLGSGGIGGSGCKRYQKALKIALLLAALCYGMHIYAEELQSKRCLLELPRFMRYSFRPPENCDFCARVQQVDRRRELSADEFTAKYAYTGRPLIVEDATRNWTAMTVFNYWYFRDVYANAKRKQKVLDCQFLPYKTGFRNLFAALEMPAERVNLSGDTEPWYFGWSNCNYETAEEFRKHYGKPYFLPSTSENNAVDWFFIGTAGLGAHMHVDNVRLPSWQAQLAGSKRWVLMPPPECYFHCQRLDVIVNTGDMIVLDTNKWYHQTFVQPGAVSLTVGAEYD